MVLSMTSSENSGVNNRLSPEVRNFLERYHYDSIPFKDPVPALRVARKLIEFGSRHQAWGQTWSQTPVPRRDITKIIEDPVELQDLSQQQTAVKAVFSLAELAVLGPLGIEQAFLDAADCIRAMRQL